MQHSDLHITIENYLANKMSEAERIAFEVEIETNELLRNEVKMYEQINSILLDSHLLDVSLSLKQYHSKSINRNKTIKTLAFIGLIVLISSIIIYTLFKPKNSLEKINIKSHKELSSNSNNKLMPKAGDINKKQNNKIKSPSKEYMISNNQTIEIVSAQNRNESIINNSNYQQEKNTLSNTNHTQVNQIKELHTNNPCSQSNIQAEFNTQGTCFNKQEGEIHILKITGGKGPYITEVINNDNSTIDRTHLKHGTYILKITDQNNCTKIYESIVIESINCKEEYVFNPSIGETWNMPVYSSNGQIQIVSKNGTVLYKNTLLANEEYTWNGVTQTGNIEYGLHSFIIQYKDGYTLNGTITIVE